jgi:hypothetical protein
MRDIIMIALQGLGSTRSVCLALRIRLMSIYLPMLEHMMQVVYEVEYEGE